jgi:hypothetical protein
MGTMWRLLGRNVDVYELWVNIRKYYNMLSKSKGASADAGSQYGGQRNP